jgi:geranylgeranyl transferase type-1 subunit beta
VKDPTLDAHFIDTFQLLDKSELVSKAPSRRYLLQITQHHIGGFSKVVGAPPDLFHSYLGLAALGSLHGGESGLKEFDVGLCCSKDVTSNIERAGKALWEASRTAGTTDSGLGESALRG